MSYVIYPYMDLTLFINLILKSHGLHNVGVAPSVGKHLAKI